MGLNRDRTELSLSIRGKFTATELEKLIQGLMEKRARMNPEVSLDRPRPGDAAAAEMFALVDPDPWIHVANLVDGGIRLWIRNPGIGWMCFTLNSSKAQIFVDKLTARRRRKRKNFLEEPPTNDGNLN